MGICTFRRVRGCCAPAGLQHIRPLLASREPPTLLPRRLTGSGSAHPPDPFISPSNTSQFTKSSSAPQLQKLMIFNTRRMHGFPFLCALRGDFPIWRFVFCKHCLPRPQQHGVGCTDLDLWHPSCCWLTSTVELQMTPVPLRGLLHFAQSPTHSPMLWFCPPIPQVSFVSPKHLAQ